jgi:tryptophan-rich sensory protein
MEKMKQAIKNKYDINFQQQKQPPKKPKNKDYLLPIILVVGFVLLVGIASLIVWERKEKISKKKIQKANKNKK